MTLIQAYLNMRKHFNESSQLEGEFEKFVLESKHPIPNSFETAEEQMMRLLHSTFKAGYLAGIRRK